MTATIILGCAFFLIHGFADTIADFAALFLERLGESTEISADHSG